MNTFFQLLVNGLGKLFEDSSLEEAEEGDTGPGTLVKASGKAAFFLFLYLEVLDASFSFDGVVGPSRSARTSSSSPSGWGWAPSGSGR